VYRGNKHEKHADNFKEKIEKRLKGNLVSENLLNFLEIGIHPLIKVIIEKNELYYLRPKQILSKLREKDDIQEKYLPTKSQLASYISYYRKNLVQKFLKNTKEDLKEFIKKIHGIILIVTQSLFA